jgi:hypothetical protein
MMCDLTHEEDANGDGTISGEANQSTSMIFENVNKSYMTSIGPVGMVKGRIFW